jgi:hypothetical protein
MVELTEAQLYNLGSRSSPYDDSRLLMFHIKHLRHEHNLPIRTIANRTGMKMKNVQKYLDATFDKYGRIVLAK